MKNTIFWAVMLVCLPSTPKMKIVSFFDTSVKLCQSMQRHTTSNPQSEDVIMNDRPNLGRAEEEDTEYEV
jgi:hypothetical protein